MKITNGKYIILIGIIHTILGLSPFGYAKQFMHFANHCFFMIIEGMTESPMLIVQRNYENFAAFWTFYFGIILFPFGILLDYVESNNVKIPNHFIWSYFIFVAIGVYMIPLSGMTVFMLPHAIYMLIKSKK